MYTTNVGPYRVENESDADYRLDELLKDPKYRSINAVMRNADILIKNNDALRTYFIERGQKMLKENASKTE